MTASRQVHRRRGAALLLAVVAGVLLVGTAPAALAHDGLVGTAPGAGTTVPAPPATVELEFTGAPLPLGTLVQVTDAAGAVVSEGDPEIRGTPSSRRSPASCRPAATRSGGAAPPPTATR
ncbi:copper resistance protein CopC [Blastococcus sp. KM273128]|nr:copper resistance protein CopC [Blastococcus sp. KM273128]MCF6743139.1 copper resistance protein CopC [Blastococcus sp. KM273128]